jgi:hypothetical protein
MDSSRSSLTATDGIQHNRDPEINDEKEKTGWKRRLSSSHSNGLDIQETISAGEAKYQRL